MTCPTDCGNHAHHHLTRDDEKRHRHYGSIDLHLIFLHGAKWFTRNGNWDRQTAQVEIKLINLCQAASSSPLPCNVSRFLVFVRSVGRSVSFLEHRWHFFCLPAVMFREHSLAAWVLSYDVPLWRCHRSTFLEQATPTVARWLCRSTFVSMKLDLSLWICTKKQFFPSLWVVVRFGNGSRLAG